MRPGILSHGEASHVAVGCHRGDPPTAHRSSVRRVFGGGRWRAFRQDVCGHRVGKECNAQHEGDEEGPSNDGSPSAPLAPSTRNPLWRTLRGVHRGKFIHRAIMTRHGLGLQMLTGRGSARARRSGRQDGVVAWHSWPAPAAPCSASRLSTRLEGKRTMKSSAQEKSMESACTDCERYASDAQSKHAPGTLPQFNLRQARHLARARRSVVGGAALPGCVVSSVTSHQGMIS
jgi:hypothetical protein